MKTHQHTVDYILEQISEAGNVAAKKMFGGYCLYCNEKVVALVCDDELFVKITEAGKEYLQKYSEKAPYKGAKPYFHITGDQWENNVWLTQLIKITTCNVPESKAKMPRKKT